MSTLRDTDEWRLKQDAVIITAEDQSGDVSVRDCFIVTSIDNATLTLARIGRATTEQDA